MSFIRRWGSAALVVLTAAGVGVTTRTGGDLGVGIVLTVLLLGCAWLVSPLPGPRSCDWATAQQLARARGVPLILWKPGCTYCIRLRLALGRAGSRAVWVDIWADEDAAAATRELNHGNETTPTMVTSDGAHTNPHQSVVKAHLQTL